VRRGPSILEAGFYGTDQIGRGNFSFSSHSPTQRLCQAATQKSVGKHSDATFSQLVACHFCYQSAGFKGTAWGARDMEGPMHLCRHRHTPYIIGLITYNTFHHKMIAIFICSVYLKP